ncbi:MAG: hypothetical protein QNJ41_07545 [Xenococcaceae cyanobacterium MO_188.B32]|nr:hypothetical protein [Xenococcaceae cyanobacterium MO_188.B32]
MKKAYKLRLSKLLVLFGSIIIASFIFVFNFLFLDYNAAFAHRPHDVVSEVKISPTYQQDRTLFIVVRGNLFKSTDGGNSWQRIVNGLDGGTHFSSLSISPSNKQVLFLSSLDSGIYKSQDEGLSWFRVNNGLDNLKMGLVSISPMSPDLVLAAGFEQELYKINNDGQTWKRVLDSDYKITAVAFPPNDKQQVIIGDKRGKLYVSSDGGDTWKESYQLKNGGAITAIAVSPNFSVDRTFLVGTEKSGIFKTTDNGISFAQANQGLSDKSITDIVISPNSKNELIFLASTWHDGLFYSQDGGKVWGKFSQGITKDSQADQLKQPHFRPFPGKNIPPFIDGSSYAALVLPF